MNSAPVRCAQPVAKFWRDGANGITGATRQRKMRISPKRTIASPIRDACIILWLCPCI